MPLAPFKGKLGSDAHKEWMAESLALNRKASKKYALRQAYLGRPLPKREWNDLRPPPGWFDNEDCAVEVEG